VYRLGDKVTVQVVKVDMERRQIDLGLSEILDRVRESEQNRGPRHSRINPRDRGTAKPGARDAGKKRSAAGAKGAKRKSRPGRKERAVKKGRR
jgi:predicted RNA-binding protein with RPS1 domain